MGSIIGLIGGLIGTIFSGLSSEIIETKIAPNQGIWLSARNAILGGLSVGILGPIVGLIGGLVVGRGGSEPSGWLILGLILGLSFTFLGALWYGGLDFIQHFTLRLILLIQGHTPRNLVPFLDHAAALILLRKVGGGYIFIHRLLLEHFAAMGQDDVNQVNEVTND